MVRFLLCFEVLAGSGRYLFEVVFVVPQGLKFWTKGNTWRGMDAGFGRACFVVQPSSWQVASARLVEGVRSLPQCSMSLSADPGRAG